MGNISKGKVLFLEHSGKVIKFNNLPTLAKRALNQYYIYENGTFVDNDQAFGYALIPMEDLIQAIGPADSSFSSFTEYHNWYMTGGIPNHNEIWPIILDADTDDIIWDGWHRFHLYVDLGVNIVPCILPMFNYI